MTTAEHLLTLDEYARLPEGRRPTELVRGRVVEFDFGTPRHGELCGAIVWRLGNYLQQYDLGHACCNDTGVITQRNPDTVRGADVSYYSYARVPRGPLPWAYLDVAPDLVFEVYPAERPWSGIMEKVGEFLNAGVQLVCVLDDDTRTARLYTADQHERVVQADEELTFPGILGDFRVRVGEFFE
jgi:Uma2 family endonuclease